MAKLLTLQNVSKIFGSEGFRKKDVTVAVDNVSFSIADDRPTITAIAGESGSGKSTLSLLMMGQLLPTTGQVLYRGKDLAKMTGEEKRALIREVQPIYQDPYAAYNPFYRVDHVLQMPIKRFGLAQSKDEGRHLIEQAMEKVGLPTRGDGARDSRKSVPTPKPNAASPEGPPPGEGMPRDTLPNEKAFWPTPREP